MATHGRHRYTSVFFLAQCAREMGLDEEYGLRMRRHIVDAVQSAGNPTVSVRCTSEARVGPWVARPPGVPVYPRSVRACNGKRDGEYAAFGLRTRRHILGLLKYKRYSHGVCALRQRGQGGTPGQAALPIRPTLVSIH